MKNFKRRNLGILIANTLRMGEGSEDNGDNDDNGGNDGGLDVNSQAFKDAVKEAAIAIASQETDGLKTKNSELITRLEKAKTKVDQFEGMDAEKVKTIMKIFEQNEEAQLIAEGKFEEVMKKRTDSIEAGFHDQLTQYKERAELAEGNSSKYKTQLDHNSIRAELTRSALKSGVRKDAIDDIVRRGLDVFSVSDSGDIEARNAEGNLVQTEDSLLMNPDRFVDSLKTVTPYYWNESNSGETGGSKDQTGGSNADAAVLNSANSDNFDLASYRKARAKQSGEKYHGRG